MLQHGVWNQNVTTHHGHGTDYLQSLAKNTAYQQNITTTPGMEVTGGKAATFLVNQATRSHSPLRGAWRQNVNSNTSPTPVRRAGNTHHLSLKVEKKAPYIQPVGAAGPMLGTYPVDLSRQHHLVEIDETVFKQSRQPSRSSGKKAALSDMFIVTDLVDPLDPKYYRDYSEKRGQPVLLQKDGVKKGQIHLVHEVLYIVLYLEDYFHLLISHSVGTSINARGLFFQVMREKGWVSDSRTRLG